MEFDEHEDQDEEIAIQLPMNYESPGNSGRPKMGGAGGGEGVSTAARKSHRYRECLKNHAVGIGGHAVDGCGEFMAAGEEGSLDALKCAACNCHRNFHRKETEGEGFHQPHHQQQHQFSPYYHRAAAHPAGYLHITPTTHQRPLALPSTSREDQENMSNPSSSGGGGGGSGSKKRFRTKFTQEQKDKMFELAERLGWRIQKHDDAAVQEFCAETGVKRHVLKVWMHNNKHTLGFQQMGSISMVDSNETDLRYKIKKCSCGEFADVKITHSNKNGNRGRLYYSCPKGSCDGFGGWCNPINLEQSATSASTDTTLIQHLLDIKHQITLLKIMIVVTVGLLLYLKF